MTPVIRDPDPAAKGNTPRVETARFGRSFGSAPLLEGEIQIPGKASRHICPISPTPKESVDEGVKVVRTWPRLSGIFGEKGDTRYASSSCYAMLAEALSDMLVVLAMLCLGMGGAGGGGGGVCRSTR